MSIVDWKTKTDLSQVNFNTDPEVTFAMLSGDLDKKWEGKILPKKRIIKLRNTYSSNILITIDQTAFVQSAKPRFKMSANGPIRMTIDEHHAMTLAVREAIQVYEQLF